MSAAEVLFAWLAEFPRPPGPRVSRATATDWGREVRMCYRREADGEWFGVTLTTERGTLHDGMARSRERAILLALHAAKTGKRSLTE